MSIYNIVRFCKARSYTPIDYTKTGFDKYETTLKVLNLYEKQSAAQKRLDKL